MSLHNELAKRLQELFIDRGLTLAAAESCTGGGLSAALTGLPGSSQYFIGAVVSYNSTVKVDALEVPKPLLQVMGEVSVPVARAMAKGVKKKLKTDWSVAITGIAGPSGGTKEKPVGTVCFAWIGPGYERAEQVQFARAERTAIQNKSIEYALAGLYSAVSPGGHQPAV